jgi:hypothetical protein
MATFLIGKTECRRGTPTAVSTACEHLITPERAQVRKQRHGFPHWRQFATWRNNAVIYITVYNQ